MRVGERAHLFYVDELSLFVVDEEVEVLRPPLIPLGYALVRPIWSDTPMKVPPECLRFVGADPPRDIAWQR
jgi:hypothetical protein